MKKILILAFLLIPFFGISQTTKPIEGFLGIKFEASSTEVIAAMKAKGAVLNKAMSNAKMLTFQNVKLGPRKTEIFFVNFYKDKAYSATFIFKVEETPQTIEYYNSLIYDINQIYGEGKQTRNFKSPYTFGDGHEVTALQNGYAKMFTDWTSGTNDIQALIVNNDDDVDISLFYTDENLKGQFDASEKAKEKSDY